MSHQENDLIEEFSKWDPMKEDFLNSDFNLYDYGPGAGLELDLQPAELAKEKPKRTQPYLVFKNLPKEMTEKSLRLLCEQHGNVQRIFELRKTSSPRFYVYFYNISDMDAVYRALKNDSFKFTVSIGPNTTQKQNNTDIDNEVAKAWDVSVPSSRAPSDVNLEDRTIIVSGKKPPRPQLAPTVEDFFKQAKSEDCSISINDPLLHCVKQPDSYELERAGFQITETTNTETECQYRSGRLHYNMPAKTKAFIETKHNNSIGMTNEDLEKYLKKMSLKGKPVVMRCIVCSNAADISCYRCGVEFYIYCGTECQNKDWENHRKICGKPKDNRKSKTPANTDATVHVEKTPNKNCMTQPTPTTRSPSIASTASSPGSSSTSTKRIFPVPEMPPPNSVVALTAINSPNMVFVRSKENKENTKFFEIVSRLQATSKLLQPLKTLPAEGQAVVAKFENSGEYGRALVLRITNTDNIRINFLDYGNVEIVKLTQLYKIPDEFMLLPRFAVPVILKGVPRCYMTKEIRSFMHTYLREINLIIKYSNDSEHLTAENIYQVDLFDAATNQHFNKTIATISQPHEPINNNQIVTIENLKKMPMPVDDDVELVVMDNSQIHVGCISCTTKVYRREIEAFQTDVQNYANNLDEQCYAPRQDELCIAKYSVDNLWYRGRCMEKVGDGRPLILFIDYGNLDYVPVKHIRMYPPEFNWPIFTADFCISGLPEDENLSDDLVKRLEDLFPVGKAIQADNVEHLEENFFVLRMDGVLKTLADEKLLH